MSNGENNTCPGSNSINKPQLFINNYETPCSLVVKGLKCGGVGQIRKLAILDFSNILCYPFQPTFLADINTGAKKQEKEVKNHESTPINLPNMKIKQVGLSSNKSYLSFVSMGIELKQKLIASGWLFAEFTMIKQQAQLRLCKLGPGTVLIFTSPLPHSNIH